MKVKVSSLIIGLIEVLVLMHLCYFNIAFGSTKLFADSFVPKPRVLLYILMMFVTVALSIPYWRKKTVSFIFAEFAILLIPVTYAFVQKLGADGVQFMDVVALIRKYIYPILAIPMIALLRCQRYDTIKMSKFIVIATTIDTIVRAIDSFVEMLTGSLPWPNLVNGSMGYRNGIYRINPAGLDILVIPMAFYLLFFAIKRREKIKWWMCIAINVAYAYIIWQARSAIIYKTALVVICILVSRKIDKKKLIMIVIGICVAVVFLSSPVADALFDSFAITNTETGGSTFYRLNAISYFTQLYKQSRFWGIGLLNVTEGMAEGGGVLADVGLLYSVIQLGVLMAVFYIVMFSRGFFIAKKIRWSAPENAMLTLSMTVSYILFNFNIDTFYLFNISVPFYLAIIELFAYEHQSDNN